MKTLTPDVAEKLKFENLEWKIHNDKVVGIILTIEGRKIEIATRDPYYAEALINKIPKIYNLSFDIQVGNKTEKIIKSFNTEEERAMFISEYAIFEYTVEDIGEN